ncbi:MAG: hypothetical protein HOJ85_13225 [Ilumatobacter sp.]|jgi:hypothetical protein|nr:hypothetical protein [Ilumatobacter sp.]MBT5276223.1 hypothetical protein [Ilumatobacter sp.]MBT5554713.1 hypothetical protein [Ilumatobacter sp.]MBT5866702.1 hypothetical protein [Ilumatobacter sp.]
MDTAVTDSPERHLWTLIEPVHAITYFAPECQQAFEDAGLPGFWRGYFGGRAAPLGAVSAGAVTALFFGFHPSFVDRAVPDIWTRCSPADALAARLDGIDRAWTAHELPNDRAQLKRAAFIVRRAAEAVADDRRPMFAANLTIEMPTKPHLALWHAATLLREHRGDGHLVALTALEIGPCDAHVVRLAHTGTPVDTVQPFRGWSDDDWIAAVGRLHERGVLDDTGQITETGAALHVAIEESTDQLATAPLRAIQSELAELAHILTPVVRALDSAVIPYPNPMGVERFDTT